jgi:hypothetical protein
MDNTPTEERMVGDVKNNQAHQSFQLFTLFIAQDYAEFDVSAIANQSTIS